MISAIKEHRSVRDFQTKPISDSVMEQILTAATRASTVGGMQLYSIVVTTDPAIKTALAPCHFNQPMVTMAPAVVTFCADVARFEQWCRQRQATPSYKNMLWFLNAAIDTLLSSENFALEAENQGLGICYLGTTLYNAEQIIEILELPVGVIPITTVVVGYAATEPPLAPRLPLEAVVHFNKYTPYSAQEIDHLWADIENSEQTTDLITQNNLPNLAQIFTKKRYTKADSDHFSTLYIKMLTQQGFL